MTVNCHLIFLIPARTSCDNAGRSARQWLIDPFGRHHPLGCVSGLAVAALAKGLLPVGRGIIRFRGETSHSLLISFSNWMAIPHTQLCSQLSCACKLSRPSDLPCAIGITWIATVCRAGNSRNTKPTGATQFLASHWLTCRCIYGEHFSNGRPSHSGATS